MLKTQYAGLELKNPIIAASSGLTDNVEIFYSEGMTLQTQEAAFDFNQSKGYGTTRVHADGYFGSLVADGFEFSGKDDILIFTGHNDITIKEESLKGR